MSPGVLMDNTPNWEYGVLIQVRAFAQVLRNQISRPQSRSPPEPDLSLAEPRFDGPERWLGSSTATRWIRSTVDPRSVDLAKLVGCRIGVGKCASRGSGGRCDETCKSWPSDCAVGARDEGEGRISSTAHQESLRGHPRREPGGTGLVPQEKETGRA
jgi:hypothetical protein